MKRLIALLLVCTILVGCSAQTNKPSKEADSAVDIVIEKSESTEFSDLNDPLLLDYIESNVYSDLITQLNSDNYFIENVQAIYISKEYLDELAYNSQSNVFFGYSLSDIEACFQDTKYVFTLGEDGTTTVKEFEKYDNTYEQILKNVTIGTGVIVLCITVSIVSGGMGAPAISMLFAASAKRAATMAVSSTLLGGVAGGIVKGIETGDFNQAIKAAVLEGSEGFKWGAISGAITGGMEEAIALKGATLNGLTVNEAALIQRESKLSLDFIKNFHSMDEYNAYKSAKLYGDIVNRNPALIQNIDWDFVGDIEDGRTNAERVLDGLSPLGTDGKSYELHHIGQKSDSPLAVLTSSQHKKYYSILHKNTGQEMSEIDRTAFEKQRKAFWKAFLEKTQGDN